MMEWKNVRANLFNHSITQSFNYSITKLTSLNSNTR